MPITPARRAFGLSAFAVALSAAMPALAEAPPPGSEQARILSGSRAFVHHMRTEDGSSSCCDLSDGRGRLDEKPFIGSDQKQHYKVLITRAAFGDKFNDQIPPEGKWVNVAPRHVLTTQHAAKVCKEWRDNNPQLIGTPEDTCYPPDTNVIWYNAAKNEVYCYYPKPKWGEKTKFLRMIIASIMPK